MSVIMILIIIIIIIIKNIHISLPPYIGRNFRVGNWCCGSFIFGEERDRLGSSDLPVLFLSI